MRARTLGLGLVLAAAACSSSKPSTTPTPSAGAGPAAQPAAPPPATGATGSLVTGAGGGMGQPAGRGARGAGRGAGAAANAAGAPAAGGRGGRGGGASVDSTRYVRTSPPTDPIIRQMWDEGMNRSQAATLAQTLFDSIGPRLTNSDRYNAGQDWLIKTYASWGVTAKKEPWGTWSSWQRGPTHIDLIAPRVHTMEGMMLPWSPSTNGKPVEADVILYPTDTSVAGMAAWLKNARGKFVLNAGLNPSCRSPQQYGEFAQPGDSAALAQLRADNTRNYAARAPHAPAGAPGGGRGGTYQWDWPKAAGVAGILTTSWSNYPGLDKVQISGTPKAQVPMVEITCEDYSLLYRLAEHHQGPKVRLNAEAQFLGEKPVFNVIATIKGSEKPNEYIVLSAHYDSWDGGTGATDNGTGTITMLEALRILHKFYPNPKRTIIVGHWGGEEEGLNGSHGWVEDNPNIVDHVVAGWNQDNGTGRVISAGTGPFTKATDALVSYLKELPMETTHWIRVGATPAAVTGTGSTDSFSFQCAVSPVFSLGALNWDYGNTTHHTNRDTYDKVVIADLKNNATLVAMLTYEADKDPNTMSHDAIGTDGGPAKNVCQKAVRTSINPKTP